MNTIEETITIQEYEKALSIIKQYGLAVYIVEDKEAQEIRYNHETKSYSIYSLECELLQNIIWAAEEIETRERRKEAV